MPKERLHAIQVLRALAAALVVGDHVLLYMGEHWTAFGDLPYFLGRFGVQVFFVISGLVMYETAGGGFAKAGAPKTFLARRFERIVPLYWFGTAVFMIQIALTHAWPFSMADVAASLLFIPRYSNMAGGFHPILAQGWTLNYEMLFYIVFAAALALPKRLGLACLFAGLGGLAALSAVVQHPHEGLAAILGFWASPLLLLFLAGVLLGWLRERISVRAQFGTLSSTAAVAAVVLLYLLNPPLRSALALFGALSIVPVAVAALSKSARGLVFESLGDASYSTYLFHIFAIGAVGRIWAHFHYQGPWAFALSAFIGAHVLGYAAHLLIERPVMGAFKKLRTSRTSALQPA